MSKASRRSTIEDQEQSTAVQQMKLPLDELLDAHPGELIPLDIDVNDIGGELLSILSTGLYTNPLDCIREYVQNAVDANAHAATIKITGNSVHIFDDGDGMALEDIIQARQFGLSVKSLTQHVGFRGIGIYSSFHLCNQLRVTSKKAGSTYQHVLVFEFGTMKAQLDQDKRKGPHERKTSLVELLSAHTRICRSQHSLAEDIHFTHVEIQDISDVHIKKLGNREELKHYMIRNLPIDFDETFEYRDQINQQLHLEVPGYNAITLTLQTDGLPDIVVTKPPIPHLQPPVMGPIVSGTGKNARKVGYYWACLNTERDRIAKNARFVPAVVANGRDRSLREIVEQEFLAYEGFVFKKKGFTVGNRDRLRHCFSSKPQLYPWYTGEIYVIDTAIVPKADRDDFETNEAKRALDLAVMQELSLLEDAAENFQATGVADERVAKYLVEVADLEREVDANAQESDFKAYTQLNEILKDLRRQEKKASPDKRASAHDIIKRAERLQRRLAKETETSQTEAARRKRAANEELPVPPTPQLFVDTRLPSPEERVIPSAPLPPSEEDSPPVQRVPPFSSLVSNEAAASASAPLAALFPLDGPKPSPLPSSSPSSQRTLETILLEAGWRVDGDYKRLVALLQASLESVLFDRTLYNSMLADFEDRLTNDVTATN